jgi:hypothetical protein
MTKKMSLIITDTKEAFTVDPMAAIELELKLNVTAYGHPWKHIGDILYDFGSRGKRPVSLEVDTHQYEFLKLLLTKNGRDECRGLT